MKSYIRNKNKLILNTTREGYGIDQVHSTMTIKELRDFLEDYDDETPVYLSFDNGYTYGGIHQVDFEEAIDDEDE